MQKRYLETTFFIKIVILKARFYINLDLNLNLDLNYYYKGLTQISQIPQIKKNRKKKFPSISVVTKTGKTPSGISESVVFGN